MALGSALEEVDANFHKNSLLATKEFRLKMTPCLPLLIGTVYHHLTGTSHVFFSVVDSRAYMSLAKKLCFSHRLQTHQAIRRVVPLLFFQL